MENNVTEWVSDPLTGGVCCQYTVHVLEPHAVQTLLVEERSWYLLLSIMFSHTALWQTHEIFTTGLRNKQQRRGTWSEVQPPEQWPPEQKKSLYLLPKACLMHLHTVYTATTHWQNFRLSSFCSCSLVNRRNYPYAAAEGPVERAREI